MNSKSSKRAWVVFVGLCIYYFVAFGLLYSSFGLFLTPMSNDLGISYATLSLTPTVRVLCGTLVTSVVAKIYQRTNLRFFLSAVVIVMGAAIFLLSRTTQVWSIMLLYAVIGVCCGLSLYSTIPMVLNQWFKAPATVISIAIACGGLGGVIITPVMSNLINEHGWRMGYIIMAIAVVVILVPISLILLDYSPARRGLEPAEGIKRKTQNVTMSLAAQNDTAYNKGNLIMCAIMFFFGSLSGGMYMHISSSLYTKGFDAAQVALFISFYQLGTMLFQLMPGFISSWIGPAKVAFISMPLLIAGAIAGIFINSGSPFILIVIVVMLMGGARLFTAYSSIYARYVFGNVRFDQAFSKLQMCTLCGAASSSFIYGGLFQLSGTYALSLILSAFSIFMALLMIFILRTRVDSKKLAK